MSGQKRTETDKNGQKRTNADGNGLKRTPQFPLVVTLHSDKDTAPLTVKSQPGTRQGQPNTERYQPNK